MTKPPSPPHSSAVSVPATHISPCPRCCCTRYSRLTLSQMLPYPLLTSHLVPDAAVPATHVSPCPRCCRTRYSRLTLSQMLPYPLLTSHLVPDAAVPATHVSPCPRCCRTHYPCLTLSQMLPCAPCFSRVLTQSRLPWQQASCRAVVPSYTGNDMEWGLINWESSGISTLHYINLIVCE